jgi:hypothetical protein
MSRWLSPGARPPGAFPISTRLDMKSSTLLRTSIEARPADDRMTADRPDWSGSTQRRRPPIGTVIRTKIKRVRAPKRSGWSVEIIESPNGRSRITASRGADSRTDDPMSMSIETAVLPSSCLRLLAPTPNGHGCVDAKCDFGIPHSHRRRRHGGGTARSSSRPSHYRPD